MWWDRATRLARRGRRHVVPFAAQAELPEGEGAENPNQAPDPTDNQPIGRPVAALDDVEQAPDPSLQPAEPLAPAMSEPQAPSPLEPAPEARERDQPLAPNPQGGEGDIYDAPEEPAPEAEEGRDDAPLAPNPRPDEDGDGVSDDEEPVQGDLDGDGTPEDFDGDGEEDGPSEFDAYPDGPQNLHEGCRCVVHRMMGGARRWEANPGACEGCMALMRAFNADQQGRREK